MPYFPIIESADPHRKYRFDRYEAVLFDRIRSAQTIQYYFALIVFRAGEEIPCLAVASEYSDAESQASPFLGVFPGEGHLNLGDSTDWLDLARFEARALEVALEQLGLPDDQEIMAADFAKKPWWRFW